MYPSKTPAHIRVSHINVMNSAAHFMQTCPTDDMDLIVQEAIDTLIFKIVGENADFSPLMNHQTPLFAAQLDLQDRQRTFSVLVLGDFQYNGWQVNDQHETAEEIDAFIVIGAPGEVETILASWQGKTGKTAVRIQ